MTMEQRIFQCAVCVVMALGLSMPGVSWAAPARPSEEAVRELSKVSDAMVEVVEAVRPSVVHISTTKKARAQRMPGIFDDPFFKRFFGDEQRRQQEPPEREVAGLGSGVIVTGDGYIITNNHVVRGAEEIKVALHDKRELSGRVVGTDPKTDIAVIKVEATGLPAITWGDSDRLRVGETVIAVGIPYGLDHTVTTGIVSAKGRANVRIAEYEDFIQTDAAINPGNSGGPLINVRGELVGINTAIFSLTGGSQGIGFAIPSNMARTVLQSLISEGKVVRGWLGVTVQEITEELARQFRVEGLEGALVSDITEGSPAERAGIKRGDVISRYDGKKVDAPMGLRNMVASTRPGTRVAIVLSRGGTETAVSVEIGELPAGEKELVGEYDNALKGTHVQDITPELRKSLKLPERLKGVIVADVESENGLQRGDVVLEINREKIADVKGYHAAASAIGPGEDILLLVYRNGSVIYVTASKN